MPTPIGVALRFGGQFLGKAFQSLKASVAGRVFGSAAKTAYKVGTSTAARRVGAGAAAVGGAVATGTAFEVGQRLAGGGAPALPAPPTGGPGSSYPGGAPMPLEGTFGRTMSRILPGGLTGREFTPYEGTETDKYGRPIAVYPAAAQRLVAPRGYVIVRDPRNPENALAILKGAARAMGLWTAKPKPPISGYDRRAIDRASRVKKRMKKLARKVEKL
jgi:hypothetical protein